MPVATPPPDALAMWTVYDHPSDYPDCFIARESFTGRGVIAHTHNTIQADTLEAIREQLVDRGLVCLPRQPADDPVIMEVWL